MIEILPTETDACKMYFYNGELNIRNTGWNYTFEMGFVKFEDNKLQGIVIWKLKTIDKHYKKEFKNKLNSIAIDYIKGNFSCNTNCTFNFNEVLIVDTQGVKFFTNNFYDLVIASNGNMRGTTVNSSDYSLTGLPITKQSNNQTYIELNSKLESYCKNKFEIILTEQIKINKLQNVTARIKGIYQARLNDSTFHYFKFYEDGRVITYAKNILLTTNWANEDLEYNFDRAYQVKGKLQIDKNDKISSDDLTGKWDPRILKIKELVMNDNGNNLSIIYSTKNINENEKLLSRNYNLRTTQTKGCVYGDCNNGKGEYIHKNGYIYLGTFMNGLPNGNGLEDYGWGFYEGEWQNGKQHGFGIFKDFSKGWSLPQTTKGYFDLGKYCCEKPCEVCKKERAENYSFLANSFEILYGNENVSVEPKSKLEYFSIFITDYDSSNPLNLSSVCKENYSVSYIPSFGSPKTVYDPFNDSSFEVGGIPGEPPLIVEINYGNKNCEGKLKHVKIRFMKKGEYNITLFSK
ncbi:MAG: hypothetical protein IPO78_04520 [Saprospiraceae bacterium]|nr:hypothetical protein [Saprospiraceae bacterium]MBK9720865.1 hypothetical protein [Saprospiraceae bacterium]